LPIDEISRRAMALRARHAERDHPQDPDKTPSR
jgi:hypothetical protein